LPLIVSDEDETRQRFKNISMSRSRRALLSRPGGNKPSTDKPSEPQQK